MIKNKISNTRIKMQKKIKRLPEVKIKTWTVKNFKEVI